MGEILEAHFYNIRLRKEGNSKKGRERRGKEPQPSLGKEKKKKPSPIHHGRVDRPSFQLDIVSRKLACSAMQLSGPPLVLATSPLNDFNDVPSAEAQIPVCLCLIVV